MVAGIILAAGKGTRMKSDLPKGLHPVCGLPMVEHVARAMRAAGIGRIVIVVGFGAEAIRAALGEGYEYAVQTEQKGTGHAALMAREALADHVGPIVIAVGDAPLMDEATFRKLIVGHGDRTLTLGVANMAVPTGYGRVLTDGDRPLRVVEERDASEAERAVQLVNVSLYCVDGPTLFEALPNLRSDNSQGEYYLTDLVAALADRDSRIVAYDDPAPLMGVNDRWQLAEAEGVMRRRLLRAHAERGTTLRDPDSILIEADVTLGENCTIEAGSQLRGRTRLGNGCTVGPNSVLVDAELGDGSAVVASFVAESRLGPGVKVGPFANVRPGCALGADCRVGNFVELKKSRLADEVKVSHLSYIGDAQIGARTNVGAGTITVNYDGYDKHPTVVGEDAFVGSNSTLIAPCTIGDRAFVVAGSVITEEVPDDAGAFGRARQVTKEGWAARWRRMRQSRT